MDRKLILLDEITFEEFNELLPPQLASHTNPQTDYYCKIIGYPIFRDGSALLDDVLGDRDFGLVILNLDKKKYQNPFYLYAKHLRESTDYQKEFVDHTQEYGVVVRYGKRPRNDGGKRIRDNIFFAPSRDGIIPVSCRIQRGKLKKYNWVKGEPDYDLVWAINSARPISK